jgi:hypothetical protein
MGAIGVRVYPNLFSIVDNNVIVPVTLLVSILVY